MGFKQKLNTGIIPTRYAIWLMIFSSCALAYMLRASMSINIIAMVQASQKTNNRSHQAECAVYAEDISNGTSPIAVPDYGPRMDWDSQIQGLILGAYFWGYILTAVPGAFLAERFGGTKIIAIVGIASAICTAVTPLVAHIHWTFVMALRFILGIFGGAVYPTLHTMIASWSPPEEKGKFIGAVLGGNLGTVITWPLLGVIMENWGWSWAFYCPSMITLIWTLAWLYITSDCPQNHPRISKEEKDFIVNSIGDTVKLVKPAPPYLKAFTSIPFWALIILHFGNLWGLSFLLTTGPKFMFEVLGFDLSKSGFLAALPHMSRLLLGFVFASIGDVIRKRKLMTMTSVRKWFVLFSHFIPGAFLIGIIFMGCRAEYVVAFIVLSLGSNGAATLTSLQNAQDLAPNYVGTLYAISNTFGTTTGFITPSLTGYITRDANGMQEWHTLFIIGASIYILSGVVFCIFGSGEIQPWNYTSEEATLTRTSEDPEKGSRDNPAFQEDDTTVKDDKEQNTKL